MLATQEALNEVSNAIGEISKQGILHKQACKKLKDAVSDAKREIESDVSKELDLFRETANDSSASMVLPLTSESILAATKIAVAGKKPSKAKESFGLLQGDCLIVTCLQDFANKHPSDRLAICSNNTSDFACGNRDSEQLHPDIVELLPEAQYYTNPVALLKSMLPASSEEDAEIEALRDSYERISASVPLNCSDMYASLQKMQDSPSIADYTSSIRSSITPTMQSLPKAIGASGIDLSATISNYNESMRKIREVAMLSNAANLSSGIDMSALSSNTYAALQGIATPYCARYNQADEQTHETNHKDSSDEANDNGDP